MTVSLLSTLIYIILHHGSDPLTLFFLNYFHSKLSQLDLFPLKVQDDELEWKISLNYDLFSRKFILLINDEPFDGMPYLAELTFFSPQNIEKGIIELNDTVLHSGWTQYNADTI